MRRVVITGLGLVTPLGIGNDDNWAALIAGKSGIGPITQFDSTNFGTHFAGAVKNFGPARWMDKREAKWMERFLHLGLAAGQMAMEDSGLPLKFEGAEAERAGCYVGAGLGGLTTLEKTHLVMQEKGPRHGI